jgi:hypothetical protein
MKITTASHDEILEIAKKLFLDCLITALQGFISSNSGVVNLQACSRCPASNYLCRRGRKFITRAANFAPWFFENGDLV